MTLPRAVAPPTPPIGSSCRPTRSRRRPSGKGRRRAASPRVRRGLRRRTARTAVAGERDVVQAERGHVERTVRDELRRVHRDPGAVAVRDPREFLDGPQFAGDVGRGRDDEQPRPDRAGAEARSAAEIASAGVAGAGSRTARFHGSSDAWCSVSKTTTLVPAGTACASRFMESVVLRVNTTADRRHAPTNERTVSRASSYAPVVTCDAYPARGGRCCSTAAPDDRVLHRLQAGRAGGVVEVGVGDVAAVPQRHRDVRPDHSRNPANPDPSGRVTAGVVGESKAGIPGPSGSGTPDDRSGSALAGTRCRVRPGLTRGTPSRTKGCLPASRGLTLALMT